MLTKILLLRTQGLEFRRKPIPWYRKIGQDVELDKEINEIDMAVKAVIELDKEVRLKRAYLRKELKRRELKRRELKESKS
ncbi:TPA: hypothetical protein HA338_02565 [Methanosarcina acetivorans]|uniref:Uncharacterized protein n=2 Tax=Methanosarcina acetivorans TaxID=2214 RepID=Q8TQX7_METAC|nr:hypothetical protein [Methanosarcina acetivorans]AAM04825.1 predicted protein [Methanosarcina acetivorans C2A]HIH92950.1 hypothetical protein [Methanosarcina acetivorans]